MNGKKKARPAASPSRIRSGATGGGTGGSGGVKGTRKSRPTAEIGAVVGEPPIQALRRDERFDRFQRAFDALDPDSRQVIFLARIQGLPIKEVARRLERSPNATSILLYRALVKLKGFFGDTESFRLPRRSLRQEGEGDAR